MTNRARLKLSTEIAVALYTRHREWRRWARLDLDAAGRIAAQAVAKYYRDAGIWTLMEAVRALKENWDRSTSERPDEWSENNAACGQCAVTAIILQGLFGGDIVRGISSQAIVHYWNIIEGTTVDATRAQFAETETFTSIEVNPDSERYRFASTLQQAQRLRGKAGIV